MEEASQNSRGRLPLSPVFLCLFSSSSGPTPSTARWPRRRPPPTPPTGQSDSQAPVGWEAWGWGWGGQWPSYSLRMAIVSRERTIETGASRNVSVPHVSQTLVVLQQQMFVFVINYCSPLMFIAKSLSPSDLFMV